MNRPDDIPEDVWGVALTLDARIRVPHMGGYDKGRIEPIARAILAERQRCACIAEAQADLFRKNYMRPEALVAEGISKEINKAPA